MATKTKLSVFIATSLDGFIARSNGNLDWLSATGKTTDQDEDYGYQEFMDTIDALIMGRNTFYKVLTFDQWPYTKKVIVLTTRSLQLPRYLEDNVTIMSGDPEKIISKLRKNDGLRHFYIDGGKTIQNFLRDGLIDELTITHIPVILGDGIPLFGTVEKDIQLHHISTKSFSSGFVQSKYKVIN